MEVKLLLVIVCVFTVLFFADAKKKVKRGE